MNNKKLLLACLFCLNLAEAHAMGFSWPIDCIPGINCVGQHFRIGFPDIEASGTSYSCGKPGYLGHQGTDIVVSSVEQGVSVLAAADGVVRWTEDGLYDHCPDITNQDCNEQRISHIPLEGQREASLGFNAGNYVVIEHKIDRVRYLTLYAHLRSNSLLTAPGKHVRRGERIALVGSSGNAQIPHLHFGVFIEEGKFYRLVDPWKGPCNTTSDGLWASDPPYAEDNHLMNIEILHPQNDYSRKLP
jgi:murein DD-endopeptidase MepM/ murein hydrolase activator NlpD